MAYINNHVYQGLSRLLEQYKDRFRIKSVLTSFISRYQGLEDLLTNIDNNVRIQTAIGGVLDRIGASFNVSRNDLSDDLYRRKIYIALLVNKSKGNAFGIINAIKLLYNPQNVNLVEHDCFVQINMRMPTNINHIETVLPAIIVSGVGYSIVYESDKCGRLANLTIGTVDFTVNDQNIEEDLIINTTNNLQVKAPVVNIPKNLFKLGVRFTNTPRYITSEGAYFVDETEPLYVVPDLTNMVVLKGSDLAVRIL